MCGQLKVKSSRMQEVTSGWHHEELAAASTMPTQNCNSIPVGQNLEQYALENSYILLKHTDAPCLHVHSKLLIGGSIKTRTLQSAAIGIQCMSFALVILQTYNSTKAKINYGSIFGIDRQGVNWGRSESLCESQPHTESPLQGPPHPSTTAPELTRCGVNTVQPCGHGATATTIPSQHASQNRQHLCLLSVVVLRHNRTE
eukprot:2501896-Amphidinium_carterae.1